MKFLLTNIAGGMIGGTRSKPEALAIVDNVFTHAENAFLPLDTIRVTIHNTRAKTEDVWTADRWQRKQRRKAKQETT